MRFLFSTLFLGFVWCCFSQQWLPSVKDSIQIRKYDVQWTGLAEYYGSSLPRSITNRLFWGGEITEALKQKGIQQLTKTNFFETQINQEFEYRNYSVSALKNNRWGYCVKGGFVSFSTIKYPKDFYTTALYGNESFSGKVLDFSRLKFSNWTFQKLGFGLVNKQSNSVITLNFYNLSNYRHADIRTLTMYQSDQTDTLMLTYNGSFRNFSGKQFTKGVGIGLDFDLRFKINALAKKPLYFQVLAQNIGFVKTVQQLTDYSSNSTFLFSGFSFNQLTNGNLIANDSDSLSSVLDTLGITQTRRSAIFNLPGLLQISKLIDMNSKQRFQSFFGTGMYLSTNSLPFVYVGLDYILLQKQNASLHVGLSLNYRGLYSYKGGTYLNYRYKNCYIALVGTNLIGNTGQSLMLRFLCVF